MNRIIFRLTQYLQGKSKHYYLLMLILFWSIFVSAWLIKSVPKITLTVNALQRTTGNVNGKRRSSTVIVIWKYPSVLTWPWIMLVKSTSDSYSLAALMSWKHLRASRRDDYLYTNALKKLLQSQSFYTFVVTCVLLELLLSGQLLDSCRKVLHLKHFLLLSINLHVPDLCPLSSQL